MLFEIAGKKGQKDLKEYFMKQKQVRQGERGKNRDEEQERNESLVTEKDILEAQKLIDEIERDNLQLKIHELQKKLEESGESDRKIGLLVETPAISLSDVSEFSLILRNSFQDVLGITGANRKIIDPPVEKIILPGSITIIIDINPIIWVGLPWLTLAALKFIVENYDKMRMMYSDIANFIKRRFQKRQKSKINQSKNIKTVVFLIIWDSKTGEVIKKLEIFRSDLQEFGEFFNARNLK